MSQVLERALFVLYSDGTFGQYAGGDLEADSELEILQGKALQDRKRIPIEVMRFWAKNVSHWEIEKTATERQSSGETAAAQRR